MIKKAELIKQLKEEAGLTSLAQAENVQNVLFSIISNALKHGDDVSVSGFGTFKKVKRSARKGRNPRTGAEIQIPASTTVKFSPSKTLKENL